MTERENMLSDQLYLDTDPELSELRRRARALTRAFNATTEDEVDLRHEILSRLFGKVGQTIQVEPPFRCDYGFNIRVGEDQPTRIFRVNVRQLVASIDRSPLRSE